MSQIPKDLVDGIAMPPSRGFLDGQWFVEEDVAAVRQSIRLVDKLHEEETPWQRLAVYQSAFFGRFLTLDDLMMFTERDEFVYHEMLTHVPLCTLAQPKEALIIGGGDCGCLREIMKHPSIERVVQCDIDERVTRVCEEYFDWAKPAAADPRTELLFADGIEYIEKTRSKFDLIIVDSTDPKGPAVGLFLRDFYKKVAAALKPGGVMTAQTESPHWNPGMVGAIHGEIRAAFDFVRPYMGFIPTYPSGAWSWAFATNQPSRYFNEELAAELEKSCRYYNRQVQTGAFALPTFALEATQGKNTFANFERAHRIAVGHRVGDGDSRST